MAQNYDYKRNSFFIVDKDNKISTGARYLFIDNEGHSFLELLLTDSFDSKEKYDNAIALNHELIHYIQELSINSCMCEGYFLDYIKTFIIRISKSKGICFPLNLKDNYKYYLSLANSEEERSNIEDLKIFNDIFSFIYNERHSNLDIYDYGLDLAKEDIQKISLYCNDLVESYAFHKSIWDFLGRNQEESNYTILHEWLTENNVYPYVYKNNKFQCLDYKKYIYRNFQYQVPFYLAINALPIEEIKKDYANCCENYMPYKYSQSVAGWVHAYFMLILEVSLGIPGVEYIVYQVSHNKKSIEEFSPVHRFFKTLQTIRKDSKFLFETKPGEDYCISFFNHIAKDNCWISYEETESTIAHMIQQRADLGHEVLVHQQATMFSEKYQNYKSFIHQIPANHIRQKGLPVLIQHEWGIDIQLMFGNLNFDESTTTDFYTEYFKSEICRYKFLENSKDKKDLYERLFHNAKGAIREIVNRLFAYSTYKYGIKTGRFNCPLSQGGCHVRCSKCSDFTNFNEVVDNCHNHIVRIGDYKTYIESEDGNVPDCMFLNYLLDNNFKF